MQEGFYDAAMAERQEKIAATADMKYQRKVLLENLSPAAGESVLELGTGNGILARELCERVGAKGRVVGIDSSRAILSMAGHICPDAEFRLADAMDLPFDDGVFDAVVAAQLLCFLPEVSVSLAEQWRVLKPGGRVVLLDTDWGSLVWTSGEEEIMTRLIQAYTSVYADPHVPRTLSRKLQEAGFRIRNRFSFTVLNWNNDEDTYAGQTAGFALPIMEKSARFGREDIERWTADQERLVAGGEFLFSLNRYVFVAEKARESTAAPGV